MEQRRVGSAGQQTAADPSHLLWVSFALMPGLALRVCSKTVCPPGGADWPDMNLITFEAAGGGLITVQIHHIAASYDERASMKLSTTAGSAHILKEMTLQRAVGMMSAALDAAEARRPDAAFRQL